MRSVPITLSLVALAVPAPASAGWSPAQPFEPAGATRFSPPQPAVEPDGTETFVWSNDAYDIIASSRPPGGSFSPPQAISPGAGSSFGGGVKVAASPNGETIAAWVRRTGTTDTIQYAVRPAGGPFGLPRDVPAGPFAGRAVLEELSLARNARGDAVLAWSGQGSGSTDIFVASRPADGEFGQPQLLGGIGVEPDAAVAPDGSAVVAWLNPNPTTRAIHAAVRGAGASEFAAERTVERGSALAQPFVAAGAGGELTALWYRREGRAHRLRYAVRRSGAEGLTAPVTLGVAPMRRYSLEAGPRGDVVAVWADRDGRRSLLRVRHRPAGRGFARARELAPATNVREIRSAVDPDGRLAVTWLRTRSDKRTYDLYASAQTFAGRSERTTRLSTDSFLGWGLASGSGGQALAGLESGRAPFFAARVPE